MDQLLFSEAAIGPISVRNRIVYCAPGLSYAGVDEDANRPTAEIAAYWHHLARGGVGLIIGEPQSIHPTSTSNPRVVENVSDDIIPRYRAVADAVHDGGAKIGGRLWHAGFLASPGYRNLPLWAPSAVRAPTGAHIPAGGGGIAYAMQARDIRTLVFAFAAAARRLRDAAFDAVEIDAGGGYLLAEFLSPRVNRRQDEYGGSLENRCRIVVEVLRAVREATGGRMAVGVRLSPDPFIEPGLVEADLPAIAAHLAGAAGVDFFNVMPALFLDAAFPQGAGAAVTRAVRAAAGVPAIYNGLLTEVSAAEALVADGIDFTGMSRALLADQRLPLKAQQGELDTIRPCMACNQTCTGGMGGLLGMAGPYCLFNPAPMEEAVLLRTRDGEGQRLLVIGAGLAGLEVARLARMRGFDVTVWERSERAGGQVLLAAAAPQRASFSRLIDFYLRQLDSWGITLELGKSATPEAVDAFDPDVVVVATGSTPAPPPWHSLSGNGSGAVERVTNVRTAMAGGARLGRRVVVAAEETEHGYQALPLCEWLADSGHEVTLVTPAFEPCMNQDFYSAEQSYRRLLRKGVRIVPLTEVTGVSDGTVSVCNVFTHRPDTLPADSVVSVRGSVADDTLYQQLLGRRGGVYSAGDCVAPRDMIGAISDALRVMQQIAPAVRA